MKGLLERYRTLQKSTRGNILTVGIILVLFVVLQILSNGNLISYKLQGLLPQICYYTILAVSLNLTVGILGELSLGHAGFMCIGAFTGAFFSKLMQDKITSVPIRFTLALLIGAGFAAIFGALIGIVVLRLRGDYLAIVTLAFGEIIKSLFNAVYVGVDGNGIHVSMTDVAALGMAEDGMVIIKGSQGITGTPHNTSFAIGVVLLILAYMIISNLINSRSGRAIMAIRDNRIAAESVGIPVTKFKLMAFTISAAIAGVAGVLYAHNIATLNASAKNFGYNMSIMILVFVVLGGIGNIKGSIIAACLLTCLPEYLRFLSDYRMLIYAIVLIVMMIFNWSPASIAWRKQHSIKAVLFAVFMKKKKEAADDGKTEQ